MATAATARPTQFLERGFFSGFGAKRDGAFKKATKLKGLKSSDAKEPVKKKAEPDSSTKPASRSPLYPRFRDVTAEPNAEDQDDTLDSVVCKHCKKTILKRNSPDHISGCLKSKQEKARKKKEAREAAQRAKERAERAGEDDDEDDDDVKDGSKRSKLLNGDDKSKKRKAEGDVDSKQNQKKKK